MSWEQRNKDFSKAQADVQIAYIEAEREVKRLESENAKLRELVRYVFVFRHDLVYKWLDATTAEVCGKSFTEQARELGVEV